MKQEAVKQAQVCYTKAQAALERLGNSDDVIDARAAWSDFLIWHQRVFNKLQNGARGDTKSWNWIGLVKNERKKEPLLRYVEQSRHSDEHGLVEITDETGLISGYGDGQGFLVSVSSKEGFDVTSGGSVTIWGEHGNFEWKEGEPWKPNAYGIVPMRFGSRLILATVQNDEREGTFEPPSEFRGELIDGRNPVTVATIMLGYMNQLIFTAGWISEGGLTRKANLGPTA